MTIEELMTLGETAAVFRVNPKTVSRWAQEGRIPCIRTLGGHRRFRRADVVELLARATSAPPVVGGDAA